MSLEWNEYCGHLSQVISSLHRAVGQYSRYYSKYKIGLTTAPCNRWYDHSHAHWRRMVVVYETRSEKYIAEAEDMLIKHGLDARYYKKCLNEVGGGGGLRSGHKHYSLYIILR